MVSPALEQDAQVGSGRGRWMVTIFNNEWNTFDQVIEILMVATCCTEEEATIEAWEAHTYQKAPVHFASEAECRQAAAVIETIGVRTSVDPEWEE